MDGNGLLFGDTCVFIAETVGDAATSAAFVALRDARLLLLSLLKKAPSPGEEAERSLSSFCTLFFLELDLKAPLSLVPGDTLRDLVDFAELNESMDNVELAFAVSMAKVFCFASLFSF